MVRVGLLGNWGEGKTTICKWVEELANKDGHIVVWLQLWKVQSIEEVWLKFKEAVATALISQDIKLGQYPRLNIWLSSLKAKLGLLVRKPLVKDTASITTQGYWLGLPVGEAIVDILQAGTEASAKQLEALGNKIGKRRIIVIIDDIERINQALLPFFFLNLYDLMNIAGFSFLLSFDDKTILPTLAKYNKTEDYGEKILEKILDLREYIPILTEAQILSFIKHEIKKWCSFVPLAALKTIITFLPNNPRKLKSLLRSLRTFKENASRYKADALTWKLLIFSQMIKNESIDFARIFIDAIFKLPDEAQFYPWLIAYLENNGEQITTIAADKIELHNLKSQLDQISLPSKRVRSRLIELCKGWQTCCASVELLQLEKFIR